MSWEPPTSYVTGYTKRGNAFQGRLEQLPMIVKAMEKEGVICVIDVDNEEVFLRGTDIDILYVSTPEGRNRIGEFSKMLDDEEPKEW